MLLLLAHGARERLIARDVALLRATAELRLHLTTAHLWLEERLSGDPVNLVLIYGNLERAEALAGGLLAGRSSEEGLAPLADSSLRRTVAVLRADIAGFRTLAAQRLERTGRGEHVGAGTDLDRQTDLFFDGVSQKAEELEAAVDRRMRDDQVRARNAFAALLTAWIAIVAASAAGLWSRERRRNLAEAALQRSEAQLREAQKMEAVGRLAGGLAHDINNYVTAITSQAELVKMKAGGDGRVSAKMDLVIGTAEKISSLIRRLLAFSRRQAIKPEIVALNRLAEGLRPMLERLLGESVELGTAFAADLWNVEIDPSQAEQVIVNLVVNAREASPRGGKITLETANQRLEAESLEVDAVEGRAAAGDYVMLAISDSGCGIPLEHRDRIFEPFFTTKEKGTASGLGLATVYGIVQQNGGFLSVYSEVGRGSTFKIYLPRSLAEVTAPPARLPSVTPGGSETLLLVEDNDDLRQAIAETLASLGYAVAVASRGEEALAHLASGAPVDLVVSDVVMPGLSRRELFERLRERYPRLPVLFISGYTDNVILRHGLLEGEFEFLEKPFSPDRLAAKIRQALSGRAVPPPGVTAPGPSPAGRARQAPSPP